MTRQQTTIMIVEDDPNDLFFLRMALEEAGVINPTRICTDGQAAIDCLKNPASCHPYLILLDLKLPKILGLDVLQWVRFDPDLDSTIILAMSASMNDVDIEKAYRLGANGYLIKPTNYSELRDLVKAIKVFWLEYNQMSPRFLINHPVHMLWAEDRV